MVGGVWFFYSMIYQDRDTWSWCWDLTVGGIGLVVSSSVNLFLFSSIEPTHHQFLIVLEMFISRMWGMLKVFEKELTEKNVFAREWRSWDQISRNFKRGWEPEYAVARNTALPNQSTCLQILNITLKDRKTRVRTRATTRVNSCLKKRPFPKGYILSNDILI